MTAQNKWKETIKKLMEGGKSREYWCLKHGLKWSVTGLNGLTSFQTVKM